VNIFLVGVQDAMFKAASLEKEVSKEEAGLKERRSLSKGQRRLRAAGWLGGAGAGMAAGAAMGGKSIPGKLVGAGIGGIMGSAAGGTAAEKATKKAKGERSMSDSEARRRAISSVLRKSNAKGGRKKLEGEYGSKWGTKTLYY